MRFWTKCMKQTFDISSKMCDFEQISSGIEQNELFSKYLRFPAKFLRFEAKCKGIFEQ